MKPSITCGDVWQAKDAPRGHFVILDLNRDHVILESVKTLRRKRVAIRTLNERYLLIRKGSNGKNR